jgi:hypothetical protein
VGERGWRGLGKRIKLQGSLAGEITHVVRLDVASHDRVWVIDELLYDALDHREREIGRQLRHLVPTVFPKHFPDADSVSAAHDSHLLGFKLDFPGHCCPVPGRGSLNGTLLRSSIFQGNLQRVSRLAL